MQHDDQIWSVIGHSHCSFRKKAETQNFCRNPYNNTALCNRHSCPLANSNYATVREEEGVCYLYMKTVERAAFPEKLWEKIKLPKNYEKALEEIDKIMQFWPKLVRCRCKQRLTKIHQYLARMRKLATQREKKLVPLPKKVERRERRREAKALLAARIDNQIERQLLDRLEKGIYDNVYQWRKFEVKEALEPEKEKEKEKEAKSQKVKDMEIEQELEVDEDEGLRERTVEFVADEDFEESDDSDIEDLELNLKALSSDDSSEDDDDDTQEGKKPTKPPAKKRRSRVEIEYEKEPVAGPSRLRNSQVL